MQNQNKKTVRTSKIRFLLKRDAFLATEYRKKARKFLHDSRKHRHDHPPKMANVGLADKLLNRCFGMRWEASYLKPAQRTRLAALALIRGKPCPGNPALLNARDISVYLKLCDYPGTPAEHEALAAQWLKDASAAVVAKAA